MPLISPRELLFQAQKELKAEIARNGSSMAALERALDLGSGYLSQVLKGKIDLKLELVFQILQLLRSDPRTYFARVIGEGELPDLIETLSGRAAMRATYEWSPAPGQAAEVHEPPDTSLSGKERDSIAVMTARDSVPGLTKTEAERFADLEARVRALETAKNAKRS